MASQGNTAQPGAAFRWDGRYPWRSTLTERRGEKDLLLWGTAPQLGEVTPQAEALALRTGRILCLLAALWETGKNW